MKWTFATFGVCAVLMPALSALSGCVARTDNQPAEIDTLREARPVGGAKDLAVNLKFDVGQFEITKASDDNLFSFDLQYDRQHYEPKFNFDAGDHASMRLDVNSLYNGPRGLSGGRNRDNDLTLRLNDRLPIDVDVTTGVSESNLDMTGLQLRRMHLRGGVGKTEVTFDRPSPERLKTFEVESGVGELVVHGLGNAQVENLTLRGGIGRTELDFTGDWGMTSSDTSIKVGVGEVRVTIPREVDVEIDAQGGLLSNISAPSFEQNGHTYMHRGEAGAAKIHIRVESGVGAVNVELI
jgi:hypothetical protein